MDTPKLFVGNLPFSTTEDQLRELFGKFGNIESIVVIKDKFTGRSRGIGFVTFSNVQEAEAAVAELHDKDFNGRPMIVNEARPMTDRPRREFSGPRRPRRDFGDHGPRPDSGGDEAQF